MKMDEYKKICDNVQVSDKVFAGYEKAMEQIRNGVAKTKEEKKKFKWSGFSVLTKVAIIIGAIFLLSGSTLLSVRAYMNHLQSLENLPDEEIINLYENVYQYGTGYMSRAMSSEEEKRYGELYELYCSDFKEPLGAVSVISSKQEYKGDGVAFCTEDGILYLPKQEMTEEELLQMVVYNLLKKYVNYDEYMRASNSNHYLNRFGQMTMEEVDEIYCAYSMANTECCFLSRDLSLEERGRKKTLRLLYKSGSKTPEQMITMIGRESEYSGNGIAFCTENCTYYFPERELTDEELLEWIDFGLKVEYCMRRIQNEILCGIRNDWPDVKYVERERIVTLDPDMEVDVALMSQKWFQAYEGVLEEYFREIRTSYETPERYYANVCFIYLNEDDVPEMLLSRGCTDYDYDDNCNTRNYLYTYKDGEAVMLTPGETTMDDFYGYDKAFRYVEGRGMVYCDYYYPYDFSIYDDVTGVIDSVDDSMSRIDIWDFDTMTRTSSNANIEMLHAVYEYGKESYDDAMFSYEYYVNVSEIVRDETTGDVKEIIGEKVDKEVYEEYEKALWKGEKVTTLSVEDFDKIYIEDDLAKALAQCYCKP